MLTDWIKNRSSPLKVDVYKGSVAVKHECLLNTDAVVCIELIEHLYQNVLDELPNNIFGYIKPKIAIFTTPNVEMNVLFPRLEGFRHDDHKFEWTRKEFQQWATNICETFKDYKVQYYDIGTGPPDPNVSNLGGISQAALFLRNDMVEKVEQYVEPVPENIVTVEPEVMEGCVSNNQNEGTGVLDEENEEVVLPVNTEDDENKQDGDDAEIFLENLEMGSPAHSTPSDYESDEEYKLIFETNYPFKLDPRSDKERNC